MPTDCLTAFLGCYLPPVGVCMQERTSCCDAVINLVLCLLFPLAVFHHFHLIGYDPLVNFMCLCIPPVGIFLSTKKCDIDILIDIVLLFVGFWFLGAVYAYVKA